MARPIHLPHAGTLQDLPGQPPARIAENIHLSFYPDAKIGVLGVNGSGKSTLLRIMAGLDNLNIPAKPGPRKARASAICRTGAAKSSIRPSRCAKSVMEGVAPQKAILDRYNELAMNYSDETADEMTRLQDEIQIQGELWDLDSKVDQAMDAPALSARRCPRWRSCPAGERRRVALCRLLNWSSRSSFCSTSRLTISMPSPVMWLEEPSAQLSRRHPDRHPRPLLSRQRHRLDPRARSRSPAFLTRSNYSAWLVQKQKRLEQEGREEEARQRTLAREQEWITASPRARQATNRQGALRALRGSC